MYTFHPIPLPHSHKRYASGNGLCTAEPQSCKQHHSHSDVDMAACVNDAYHLTCNTNKGMVKKSKASLKVELRVRQRCYLFRSMSQL